MLLVRPIGGGKNIVFNTIVAYIQCITLCVLSLLSFSANQERKVMESAHDDHSIASFHVDEMLQKIIKQLLSSIKVFPSGKTVLILSSHKVIVSLREDFLDYITPIKLEYSIVVY